MTKSKPQKKILVTKSKSNVKPAAKAEVKTGVKAVTKVTSKVTAKSLAAKQPVKSAQKPTSKSNVAATKSAVKTILKPADKSNSKSVSKVAAKTSKPAAAPARQPDTKSTASKSGGKKVDVKPGADKEGLVASVKSETKASKTKAAKKPEKKAEEAFDDDIIGDDFGESEIAEYEEDLKAVEEDDEDLNIDLTDDEDSDSKSEEIFLTDSEGRRLCRVRDCDQVASVEGYCRYHYLLLWKKIQIRKHILLDGKLEKYVEDLLARYPDKFLEVVRKDLKSEKDFLSVIQELEIDESNLAEAEGEDEVQSFADEIRGIGEAPAMEDDGDF